MLTVVRTDAPQEIRLRMEGVLDVTRVSELTALTQELSPEAGQRVVVDLSGLRLIDCAGAGALFSLCRRGRERGSRVQIEGVRDQPLVLLRQLGLERQ